MMLDAGLYKAPAVPWDVSQYDFLLARCAVHSFVCWVCMRSLDDDDRI